MELENIFYIVLYFTIFISILLYIVLVYNRRNIIDNWDKYKCNPLVIPFSSFFGKNSSDALNTCLTSNFTNNFNIMFKPFNSMLAIVSGVMTEITKQINSIRTILRPIRSFIENVTGMVYKKIEGLVHLSYMSYLKMDNVTKRVLSNFRLIVYSLEASQFSMQSTFNGPIMDAAKFWAPSADYFAKQFCFSPDTLVSMLYRPPTRITDVMIGDTLSNKSTVTGKLFFNNLDNLVDVRGTRVSKYHLILEDGEYHTCESYPSSKIYDSNIVCLITSNSLIPILNYQNKIDYFCDYIELPNVVYTQRPLIYKHHSIKGRISYDPNLFVWNTVVTTLRGPKFLNELRLDDVLDRKSNKVIGIIQQSVDLNIYDGFYTGSVIDLNNSTAMINLSRYMEPYSGLMYNIVTSSGYFIANKIKVADYTECITGDILDNMRHITLNCLNYKNNYTYI